MLEHVGFEPRWQFYLDELGRPELEPARVLRVDRGQCRLLTRAGERDAVWRRPLPVVGEASTHALAVGDWCAAASGWWPLPRRRLRDSHDLQGVHTKWPS